MNTTGHMCSQRGTDREENQDLTLVRDSLGLYAITDGTGTHGLKSSQLALDAVEAHIRQAKASGVEDPEALVHGAFEAANDAVRAAAQRANRGRSACSMTLALVDEDTLVVGHLGDTRAFLVRDGVISLTRDDTLRSELVLGGLLEEEASWTSRHQYALTKAVGMFAEAIPRTTIVPMSKGDRLLLSSNGAYRSKVGVRKLWGYIHGQSSATAVEAIVESAVAGGDDDDVTALLIDVEGPLPESRDGLERLQQHPIFAGHSLAILMRLRNIARVIRLTEPGTLMERGDELSTMYVVVRGALTIQEGDRRSTLGAGSVLGYSRLLWSAPCIGRVVAEEPIELLAVHRKDFRQLARSRPWAGLRLLFGVSAYVADNPDPV